MHGFGIARRIENISRGVFKVNPGSLMVAFRRVERDGLIDPEWRQTENGRQAKYCGGAAYGLEALRDGDHRTSRV